MSEQQERANTQAQEVLQASELTARLLRRLIVSPGIIDVRKLRQFAARMTVGIARTFSLLDDLIARYGIDSATIENTSLVMERPWMVNINAYLTNYNSYLSTTNHNAFPSTTNQFISSAAAAQPQSSKSLSSISLLSDTFPTEPLSSPPSQSSTDSTVSSVHVPSRDAKPALNETASLPLPAGEFRVSRSPARRVWERHSADAQDAVRNAALKPSEDSTGSASTVPAAARIEAGKIEDGKSESAKASTSANTTPATLPLAEAQIAQSQIHRKSLEESATVLRPVEQIREGKDTRQSAEAVRPTAPAAASIKLGRAEPTIEINTAESSHSARAREGVPRPTSKAGIPNHKSKTDIPTSASATRLPLVQKQNASPPIQKRPPDFIWRKGADVPTMKDFASAISNASPLQSLSRTTGRASSAQPQQQHSQTFTPEIARRKDETQAVSGISTERILRNISRKLLIERERRGY
ncbi:MAG TPA: hypothetical protein VNG71_12615 [Pyrinomonadaceae bacterium]|nr:hypothetical protein [Pyrinomonadaceae bacterium]